MTRLAFDAPMMLWVGPPLALALLVALARAQWKRGLATGRVAALTVLRGLALLMLVGLAARPVWDERDEPGDERRSVVLLIDRSESMMLEDDGESRFRQAVKFTRDRLLPDLKAEGLSARALLFAAEVEPVTGAQLVAAVPDGKRTNLAGAIVKALHDSPRPPLAIIALTDGAATENADNARALSALLEARAPVVGIGFGTETGARTITLRHAEAPPTASKNQEFRISARLETTGEGALPAFDLVLLRDGQFHQKKTVKSGRGARTWLESFTLTEENEGSHVYTIQLLPPDDPGLKCVNNATTAAVRIAGENELRVLFAQGALTWNYKFINIALRNDPAIKLTGVSRTSSQSVYYQNVETAAELASGFPTKMEELAPYRVVVLSNLRPSDLSSDQQYLLARYCGEYGGGVLVIGGAETFDASWRRSRLEQLLPVRFASAPAAPGPQKPFRLRPTEEALRHPVFQIGAGGGSAGASVWDRLPTFVGYGRVDAAKPGAQVWLRHSDDKGPDGPRVLMAAQPYGSGLTAVVCVPNLWRWRLAKESETAPFDRFWQQLFRYLAEGSNEGLAIRFPDQELRPRSEVRALVERRPDPKDASTEARAYRLRVEDEKQNVIVERALELAPARPVDVAFPAEHAGVYTLLVLDADQHPLCTRTIEIKDVNVEFERAALDLENLRQWAGLTDGVALKAGDCESTSALIATIKRQAEQARRRPSPRAAAGINGWVLAALLACLSAEWLLRKSWGLA